METSYKTGSKGPGPWRVQGRALAFLLLLSGPTDHGRILPQDAYVWQRVWTPELADALRRTAPLVAGFRVLVAEWSPDGHLVSPAIDWPLLRSLGRPVTAVVRIDGRGTLPPPDAVPALIPHGTPLAGLELDYDCPTGRLAAYRGFLHALRPLLPPDLRLTITALPDWLRAGAFPALSREPDRLVLQVHATADPRLGLFDRDRMLGWTARMDRLSARPFLVSLPAYGVRVLLAASGQVLATEAERPALLGGAGTELAVAPARVAAAVRALEQDPPRRLVGLAWFRVPTQADARGWSLASWMAVLGHRPLVPRLTLRPVPQGVDGLRILLLANDGDADAALPAQIPLGSACTAADGAGPYVLSRDGPAPTLDRVQDGLLRAGRTIRIGWARCPLGPRDLAPD